MIMVHIQFEGTLFLSRALFRCICHSAKKAFWLTFVVMHGYIFILSKEG